MDYAAATLQVYMLAFGVVPQPNVGKTWEYVRSRIDPLNQEASMAIRNPTSIQNSTLVKEKRPLIKKNPTAMKTKATYTTASTDDAAARETAAWPPPPPPGTKNGMPCGTYMSQFVMQALYLGNPSDHGVTALALLTSTATNSWRHMIKQGATTTMEMWTRDEKPNLTWSHVWSVQSSICNKMFH